MKAFIWIDTAGDAASCDLNVEDGQGGYMGDEVDIPEGQFKRWHYVLATHKDDDTQFLRVQSEMRQALAKTVGTYTDLNEGEADPRSSADWWKEQ